MNQKEMCCSFAHFLGKLPTSESLRVPAQPCPTHRRLCFLPQLPGWVRQRSQTHVLGEAQGNAAGLTSHQDNAREGKPLGSKGCEKCDLQIINEVGVYISWLIKKYHKVTRVVPFPVQRAKYHPAPSSPLCPRLWAFPAAVVLRGAVESSGRPTQDLQRQRSAARWCYVSYVLEDDTKNIWS